MINLPEPTTGCPDWCQKIGHHTTHHHRWSKITLTGGSRPLGIRFGLILPSRHRRPRVEMMIYRGASEIMRFGIGGEQADVIARELTKAALVARTTSRGHGRNGGQGPGGRRHDINSVDRAGSDDQR